MNITFTIPDDQVTRVATDLNYQTQIDGVDNPETARAYITRITKRLLIDHLKYIEVEATANAARKQKETELSAL